MISNYSWLEWWQELSHNTTRLIVESGLSEKRQTGSCVATASSTLPVKAGYTTKHAQSETQSYTTNMIMAEETESNTTCQWAPTLSSSWFLSTAGSHLSFEDLRSLSWVSRGCKDSVQAWVASWPQDVQELYLQSRTKLMVFGGSRCFREREERKGIFEFRNPAPIMEFPLGSLAFDNKRDTLNGRPWREFPLAYSWRDDFWGERLRLGTKSPIVCAANDSGTQIFYYGGFHRPRNGSTERWISDQESYRVTHDPRSVATTALFDVETGSWRSLLEPGVSREGAGVCRIQNRIYVVGGVRRLGFYTTHHETTREVMCFDLDNMKWVDPEIPDYPGREGGGAKLAVVALDDTTIGVVGGYPAARVPEELEAFSLNIVTRTWTRLPDLPAWLTYGGLMRRDKFACFRLYNADGKPTFAVKCGYKFGCLSPATGQWEALPDFPDDFFAGGCCVVATGDGTSIFSFGDRCHEVYSVRSKTWRALPFSKYTSIHYAKNKGCSFSDLTMGFRDGNGDPVAVQIKYHDRIVEVRPGK